MTWIEFVGYAAAFCTTAAYLPQVTRVWRTRQCEDVSLKMLLILMTGLALWLAFGLIKGEFSIVLANAVTFLLAGVLLTLKLRGRGARSE
jgi:MtN3 and saliva related transmembrane protein